MGGENNKKMQIQHLQAEDMLIGHPITNLHVNEALLSANGSTTFLDGGGQIALHNSTGFVVTPVNLNQIHYFKFVGKYHCYYRFF